MRSTSLCLSDNVWFATIAANASKSRGHLSSNTGIEIDTRQTDALPGDIQESVQRPVALTKFRSANRVCV